MPAKAGTSLNLVHFFVQLLWTSLARWCRRFGDLLLEGQPMTVLSIHLPAAPSLSHLPSVHPSNSYSGLGRMDTNPTCAIWTSGIFIALRLRVFQQHPQYRAIRLEQTVRLRPNCVIGVQERWLFRQLRCGQNIADVLERPDQPVGISELRPNGVDAIHQLSQDRISRVNHKQAVCG